jgi:hypothetical protein
MPSVELHAATLSSTGRVLGVSSEWGALQRRKPKIDAAVVHKLRYGEKLGPAANHGSALGRASISRVREKQSV